MVHFAFPYSQVWTIPQNQEEALRSFLFENEVNENYFKSVLNKYGAAFIEFGPEKIFIPQQIDSIKKTSSLIQKIPIWIWGSDLVDVYMPPYPRVLNHLWVVSKDPIDTMSDMSQMQYLALRKVTRSIQTILRERYDTPTVITYWNQAQSDHIPKRFTIEVIPAHPQSFDKFNALDKAECNNHIFWRGKFPAILLSPTDTEIEKTVSFWKEILPNVTYTFALSEENEPIQTISAQKIEQARQVQVLRDALFQILEENCNIERKDLFERPIKEPGGAIEGKTKCIFCDEAVRKFESIGSSDFCHVLYNYKPMTPKAHFLIIPHRHVMSSENLNEQELKDLHMLTCILIELLEETHRRSDIVVFIQDHPVVAQSIPHSHAHVVLTPNMFRFLLFSMNYIEEATLSRNEIGLLIADLKIKFKEKQRAYKYRMEAKAIG